MSVLLRVLMACALLSAVVFLVVCVSVEAAVFSLVLIAAAMTVTMGKSAAKPAGKPDNLEVLSDLNAKLVAASKAKSDFLARMSHEIRTPMNAITGMTELALREEMSPAAQEHVLTIKHASANLLSLINDILDISKIERGKLEIIPAVYTFSSLINDVVSIIRMRVMDSPIRFVVNVDSNIPNLLFGDETRIRQALLNVLTNAVKYTDKGSISFVVGGEMAEGGMINLTIDVADTGRGIREEDIGKLFGDFVQVDVAANKGIEGSGLGLVITKNLVKAMGGDISVISEYGGGSTFTITLPQRICSHEPIAAVNNPQGKSVLVYEQRELYADSMVCTIDNLGVSCKYARNDGELRERLKAHDFTFVFAGSHLLDSVRKTLAELNSSARIVMLTEFGDAVADKGLSVIAMPAYSVTVADILNGVSDIFSYSTNKRGTVRFCAPDARVLVVDDVNTNLKVSKGLLAPYKMQIDTSLTGADAVEKARMNVYDLVLMDHMMPGMDGMEAAKRIRALGGSRAGLPIIALTANAVVGAKEMFLSSGFNDFLSKPVNTVRLNSVLEKWIPKAKQMPAEVPAEDAPSDAGTEFFVNFSIEGVDTRLGLSRTGGTVDNYLQTLAVFYSDMENKAEEINGSMSAGDLPLYVTHVHALKSAAANIGAVALSASAKALEEAGRRGDRAFIVEYTPRLFADMKSVQRGIGEVVSSQKGQGGGVDIGALDAALSALGAAIGVVDPAAINAAVLKLERFQNAAAVGGAVENILRHVLGGQYNVALPLIAALMQDKSETISIPAEGA